MHKGADKEGRRGLSRGPEKRGLQSGHRVGWKAFQLKKSWRGPLRRAVEKTAHLLSGREHPIRRRCKQVAVGHLKKRVEAGDRLIFTKETPWQGLWGFGAKKKLENENTHKDREERGKRIGQRENQWPPAATA